MCGVSRIPFDDNCRFDINMYREKVYSEVIRKKKDQKRQYRTSATDVARCGRHHAASHGNSTASTAAEIDPTRHGTAQVNTSGGSPMTQKKSLREPHSTASVVDRRSPQSHGVSSASSSHYKAASSAYYPGSQENDRIDGTKDAIARENVIVSSYPHRNSSVHNRHDSSHRRVSQERQDSRGISGYVDEQHRRYQYTQHHRHNHRTVPTATVTGTTFSTYTEHSGTGAAATHTNTSTQRRGERTRTANTVDPPPSRLNNRQVTRTMGAAPAAGQRPTADCTQQNSRGFYHRGSSSLSSSEGHRVSGAVPQQPMPCAQYPSYPSSSPHVVGTTTHYRANSSSMRPSGVYHKSRRYAEEERR